MRGYLKRGAFNAVLPKVLPLVSAAMLGCVSTSSGGYTESLFTNIGSNPQNYDGERVTLTGFMVLRPDARHFWRSERAREQGNPQQNCFTLTGISRFFSGGEDIERRTTVTGVFRESVVPPNAVDLAMCGTMGIEVMQVGSSKIQ